MEDIVIIGTGPAGLTAAIYMARANCNPVVLAGLQPGGLLTQTTDIENFPGFPNAINGFELMMNCQQQAEKFGARILYEVVDKVELREGGPHKLFLTSGEVMECKALIIATGSSPRWLGLESEERLKNHGVSACATCDGAFHRGVPVVVIGGGDSAMEEALFLTKFASTVTLIHRREEFRASKIMLERARAHEKIKFVVNSVVQEVLGEQDVEGLRLENVKTGEISDFPCKAVFMALGHDPNTELFRGQLETDAKGFIQTVGRSTYTSVEGVFVAGDCADDVYRQAVTAAGTGAAAAIDAERWMASKE
jgi:thioredoxin reductase (NADPH)